MKHRISRLSIHQNGKVVGILALALSLPFLLVALLLGPWMPMPGPGPGMGHGLMGAPFGLVILGPLVHALLGYVVTVVVCAFYNLTLGLHGGFEFDSEADPDQSTR